MENIYEILKSRNIGTLNALELRQMIMYDIRNLLTESECDSLSSAIDLATVLHSKQTRRNRDGCKRTPYIEHPLRNTLRILKWGISDIDILIASVLHDVVEDCSEIYCRKYLHTYIENIMLSQKHLLDDIAEEYGERVHKIVKDVTNSVTLSTSPNKNELYVEHVKTIIHNNSDVFYVKFSDYIDNAAGLWHGSDGEFIKRQSAKYLPLIEIFQKEIENLESHKLLKLPKSSIMDMKFKLDYTSSNMMSIL
jgi:(p)ppGpp synthase/HD superfamily hydrolase